MALIMCRSVVRIPYISGIPEDVATNVFHFQVDTTAPGGVANNATVLLREMYQTAQPGQTHALGAYYSSLCSRAADAISYTAYNEADPEPRAPLGTFYGTLPAPVTADSLPPEVALCLSWRGVPDSGISREAIRNRVYLGPFNSSAIDLAGDDGRPSAALLADVALCAAGLFDDDSGGAITWMGWSPSVSLPWAIAQAWVDNEFDTQRRRGRRATSRTVVVHP